MSINGLQQQYFNNSLDGLTYLDVNGISVNGDNLDPNAYVLKAGDTMSGTLNMGVNPVKSSYVPAVDADLVNRKYMIDNLIVASTDLINIVALNYLPYTNATQDTDLGSKNIQTTHAPTVGKDLTNKTYVDGLTTALVPYTGATSNVNLNTKSLTAGSATFSGTITNSGIATGTPAYTVGVDSSNNLIRYANPAGAFTGTVNSTKIPYASSTNVLADSLLSQSGTTITNSGNQTVNGSLNVVGQMDVSYQSVSVGAMTTSGLPSIAPSGGTISGTYTLTASGSSLSSAMKISTSDFHTGVRYTITFNGCYGSSTGMGLYVFQASSSGTTSAVIADAGFYTIPISAGTVVATFVAQKTMSYLGTIYFRIDSSVNGASFNWSSFTITQSTITTNSILNNLGKYVANINYSPPATGIYGGNGDKIILYRGDTGVYPYSLGIEASTLWYSSPALHKWYSSGTEYMRLDGTKLGIGNTAPTDMLCVGTATTSGNIDGAVVIAKTSGGSNRKFRMGYDPTSFEFCLGDYGYASSTAWVQQMRISYTAPDSSLTIDGNGAVGVYDNLNVNGDFINHFGNNPYGVGIITNNGDKGVNCYAYHTVQAPSNNSGGSGACYWWINSYNRSADGGALTATLRNDSGTLRLLSSGSQGLIITGGSGLGNYSTRMTVNNATTDGGGAFNIFNNQGGQSNYTHFNYTDGWNYIRGVRTQFDCLIATSSATLLFDSTYSRGIYTPEATYNNYGTLSVGNFTGRNGWAGYGLKGKACFMILDSGFEYGIHDNQYSWAIYCNGSSDRGVKLSGSVLCSQNWDRIQVYNNGYDTSGGYFYSNQGGGYGMISDKRIKKDIITIDSNLSRTFINGLEPTIFCLKQENGEGGCHKMANGDDVEDGHSCVCNCQQSGFIAQNVLESAIKSGIPKSVCNNWYDYEQELDKPDEERKTLLGVSIVPIVSHLVNVVKEQQKQIENLIERSQILEDHARDLENQLTQTKNDFDDYKRLTEARFDKLAKMISAK